MSRKCLAITFIYVQVQMFIIFYQEKKRSFKKREGLNAPHQVDQRQEEVRYHKGCPEMILLNKKGI